MGPEKIKNATSKVVLILPMPRITSNNTSKVANSTQIGLNSNVMFVIREASIYQRRWQNIKELIMVGEQN